MNELSPTPEPLRVLFAMKNRFNTIAILAASASHILTASLVTYIGRTLAAHFNDVGGELSVVSQVTVNYSSAALPMLVGVIFGAITLVGLLLVNRSEKLRWLLPFLLTVSFLFVILQLAVASLAIAVPFANMIPSMSE